MADCCPPKGSKFGWALVLCCPACAGGLAFALSPIIGLSAAGFKAIVAGTAGGLLLGLWARNAWRRRGENAATAAQD